jgi:glucose-1-phosphate thymidylyltransferase
MKAVILAAGYATRLRPLTETIKKELLPVGGRPIIDWIVDRVDEVQEIDEIHVVTNHRFAPDLKAWAERRGGVTVHDDATTSNEDRLGAIGDLRFAVEEARLQGDHLLVVAGDNLFDYSLARYVDWWHGKGTASAIAVRRIPDRELIKQYGVITIDDDERITSIVEKPDNPQSDLAATATYIYHREHAARLQEYLEGGNAPDQPGRFPEWLVQRAPIYGYAFEGLWMDIGDRRQLLEADNLLRERQGLPPRAEYSTQI